MGVGNSAGVVEIQGKLIPVQYRYLDMHTIECEDEAGNQFMTHYKSLVVGGNAA